MDHEQLREALREELKPLKEDIKQTRNLLTGNGTPEKGLIVRVDRIEQSEKSRGWWIKTVGSVSVAAIASSVFNFFK